MAVVVLVSITVVVGGGGGVNGAVGKERIMEQMLEYMSPSLQINMKRANKNFNMPKWSHPLADDDVAFIVIIAGVLVVVPFHPTLLPFVLSRPLGSHQFIIMIFLIVL